MGGHSPLHLINMIPILPVCTIIKDVVVCAFDLNLLITQLEELLPTVIENVVALKSRKLHKIDQPAESSVSKTTTNEYDVLKRRIEEIEKKIIELTKKHCRSVDENGLKIADLDGSSAEDLFRELEKRKLKIVTRNPLKLAKLKLRLTKWNNYITGELKSGLNQENLLKKKERDDDQHDQDEDINDGWTKRYVDLVLGRLENNRVVGIVGPMGMGSTVIKMLKKRLSLRNENNKLQFHQSVLIKPKLGENDKVIETLPNQIMKALDMDKDDITDDVDKNKQNIANFLRRNKRILLMDDVSSWIDIKELVFRNQHDGKVVFASSNKRMAKEEADDVVKIEELTEKDSKTLFDRAHGPIDSLRKEEFSEQILDSCGGIPQVIIQIAKYLRIHCKDERSWERVRDSLQGNVTNKLLGNPTQNKIFMMHYEKLKDPVKKCLLYEALFPLEEKLYKDYLIECWIAEEFIDAKNGFRSGRNEGSNVLSMLTDVYMLDESTEDERVVMMPRYFRTMALDLKYPGEDDCKIWTRANGEEPDDDTWKTATRISLMQCETSLPESPQSEKLRTLLMQQHRQKSESIPLSDDFFRNMKKLLMLDLQGTKLKNLPGTVEKLESLRCLYLTNCASLCSLPIEVCKLKRLQLLDISGTGIGSLPQEIQFLVALRCLRATLDPKPSLEEKEVEGSRSIIPLKLIEGLKKLEELSIDIIKCEGWKNSIDESIVDEMASLEHLNSLRYNFTDIESLIKFASSSKSLKNKAKKQASFTSFEISVDFCEQKHKYSSQPRTLNERRVSFYRGNLYRNDLYRKKTGDITDILKQAKIIELIGARVECLSEVALDGVEVCVIEDCTELKYVINTHKVIDAGARRVLWYIKKLHLYYLKSLQHIWEGPVSTQSLKQLEEIKLHGCPKLEMVLNLELAKALPMLKYLEVKNCCKISHVLVLDVPRHEIQHAEYEYNILNELETLILSNMPELESICISTSLNWESLRGVVITNCDKLMNLTTLEKAQRLTISGGARWKAEVMHQEENRWLLEDKFEIIDESWTVRASHEDEASTSGGTLNPSSVLHNNNEKSVSDDGEDEKISAYGNGENPSSDDKQELFVGTSGAGSSSQQKAKMQDLTAGATSTHVPAEETIKLNLVRRRKPASTQVTMPSNSEDDANLAAALDASLPGMLNVLRSGVPDPPLLQSTAVGPTEIVHVDDSPDLDATRTAIDTINDHNAADRDTSHDFIWIQHTQGDARGTDITAQQGSQIPQDASAALDQPADLGKKQGVDQSADALTPPPGSSVPQGTQPMVSKGQARSGDTQRLEENGGAGDVGVDHPVNLPLPEHQPFQGEVPHEEFFGEEILSAEDDDDKLFLKKLLEMPLEAVEQPYLDRAIKIFMLARDNMDTDAPNWPVLVQSIEELQNFYLENECRLSIFSKLSTHKSENASMTRLHRCKEKEKVRLETEALLQKKAKVMEQLEAGDKSIAQAQHHRAQIEEFDKRLETMQKRVDKIDLLEAMDNEMFQHRRQKGEIKNCELIQKWTELSKFLKEANPFP